MSIELMNEVAKAEFRSSGQKYVALALANYADEEGACFPSIAKLAAWTQQADKTVRDHLNTLEEDGFISRERARRSDGTMGVYRYRIQRQISPVADFASGENYRWSTGGFRRAEPSTTYPSTTPSLRSGVTRAKATRLSPDWMPSPEDYAFAVSAGLTEQQLQREADRFRDYWLSAPGARGTKLDWHATWRNWIRRSTELSTGPLARRSGAGVRKGRAAIGMEMLAEMMANTTENFDDAPTLDL